MSDLHEITMTDPTKDVALTETERKLISALLGCGCCVSNDEIDALVSDSCPRDEDGDVDHRYGENCSHNRSAALERLITQKVAMAITHARLNSHITP